MTSNDKESAHGNGKPHDKFDKFLIFEVSHSLFLFFFAHLSPSFHSSNLHPEVQQLVWNLERNLDLVSGVSAASFPREENTHP